MPGDIPLRGTAAQAHSASTRRKAATKHTIRVFVVKALAHMVQAQSVAEFIEPSIYKLWGLQVRAQESVLVSCQ
jgi:hypothetical protein